MVPALPGDDGDEDVRHFDVHPGADVSRVRVPQAMTDPAIAEAARMLAARRPRATYTCEVCGENFEALVRTGSKAPRTCPRPKSCRDRLYRQRKAAGRG